MLVIDGYSLVVPPEWELFDLQDDPRTSVDRWVEQRLLGLGTEVRRALRAQLREPMLRLLAGLKERGGSAVLVPSSPLQRTLTNPALVVRLLTAPDGTDPIDLIVATAASDPTAELIEQDDFVGLRSLEDVEATENTEHSLLARLPEPLAEQVSGSTYKGDLFKEQVGHRRVRRVRYLAGRPDAPDRWLDISGSVGYHDDPDSRELADAITSLFDAVVESLTWEVR